MSAGLDRAAFVRVGAAATLAGGLGLRAPAAAAGRAKRLLGPRDVRLLGAFRMPTDVKGLDAAWGNGLALRRVGGRIRLFSLTVKGELYEVALPQLRARPPYREAALVRLWGDVYGGRRLLDPPASRGNGVIGLHWDEPGRRLYWTYGDGYNTVSARDPFLGASLLDDKAGTARALGPWRLRGRSVKMCLGGLLSVPQPFADRWCRGRRLAAGFGGYFSIATVGPVSMGPALAAFSPDALQPDGGTVDQTALVGYPFNAEPYTQPGRARRDPGYRTEFDGWNPKDGIGYWSWTDYLAQAGVWIDTPAVEGVLFLPTMGVGRTWYEASTLRAENAAHWWFVYDPADLARVASGLRKQWQIQPRRFWRVRVPGLPDPLPGWADSPRNLVTGAVFDHASSRLYVAVRFGTGPELGDSHLVLVYGVARR
ncbi:MAG: hypothetical protein ACKVUT_01050 [Gaiella sp.]